jgi:hypothetical protein
MLLQGEVPAGLVRLVTAGTVGGQERAAQAIARLSELGPHVLIELVRQKAIPPLVCTH